jgi:hypothetical protein
MRLEAVIASDEKTKVKTSTETVTKAMEYALSFFLGERFFQRSIISL